MHREDTTVKEGHIQAGHTETETRINEISYVSTVERKATFPGIVLRKEEVKPLEGKQPA